jgi:hypothetical protein
MNDQTEPQNLTPTPEAQNSTNGAPKPRRLWGKIPNLPVKVRLQLNQSIRDAVPYTQIVQDLAAAGYTHINHDNLCNWYKTGYADWLRDQEHFEQIVLATDRVHTEKTRPAKRKNFRALIDHEVAVLLSDAARQFNVEKVREQLNEKPDTFFRLVHANAIHERNAILRDRNEIELKKIAKKQKATKRAAAPRQIPTRMDIERYKRDLRIVAPEHQPAQYREAASTLPSAAPIDLKTDALSH